MKLSYREKFGYGLGDTASNFIWGTMISFLLFYYTDIFGIPAAAAGTLFLFARVSDGFVDLIVGATADRTKTRWGKFPALPALVLRADGRDLHRHIHHAKL